MLNDASGFQKIYLATGYTDLRRGMEGLANIIRFHFHLDPYDRNTLFLFCGKRTDRIKVLAMVRLRKRDIFRRKRFIENSIKTKKSDIS